MVTEIRERSQITIPSEIVKKMGISKGDMFEIIEKDGGIFLCPVVVYPKEGMEKIAKTLRDFKDDELSRKSFKSVEDMFADMGININDL